MDKSDMRVVLKPEVQKELFTKLLRTYPRIKLAGMLNISPAMLYHYRNGRVNNISEEMLSVITKLLNLTNIKENILSTHSLTESINNFLNKGREIRTRLAKEKFESCNIDVNLFVKGNIIDIEKWLEKTGYVAKLKSQTGLVRKVEVSVVKDSINFSYEVYNKRERTFTKITRKIPRKIEMTLEVLYFFGLRFGDGTGHERLGIVNKEISLITFAFKLLKKVSGNSFVYVQINQGEKYDTNKMRDVFGNLEKLNIKLNFYKIPSYGDYVISVYIINRILTRCLDNILNDLIRFFQNLTFRQKGAFLAGFFDAEGNVNLRDGNIRLSQEIKRKVEAIGAILENEGYHTRYDGSSFVIGHTKACNKADLNRFQMQISPFVKHPRKIELLKRLMRGYLVRDEYKTTVKVVANNQSLTHSEICKIIGRRKYQEELSALCKAGYLTRERKKVDESFKYDVTISGLKWIE